MSFLKFFESYTPQVPHTRLSSPLLDVVKLLFHFHGSPSCRLATLGHFYKKNSEAGGSELVDVSVKNG